MVAGYHWEDLAAKELLPNTAASALENELCLMAVHQSAQRVASGSRDAAWALGEVLADGSPSPDLREYAIRSIWEASAARLER